jgi:AraC-like DNA-binding protein
MFRHVKTITNIGYFSAPPQNEVTPATIPENIECIEILTAGKIFFEVDGAEKEYQRGAVFWHLSGEKTIYKTSPDDPYCCVVIGFLVNERKRITPEASYWALPEDGAVFAEKCLKRFHAGVDDKELFTTYAYSTLLWNSHSQRQSLPWPPALKTAIEFMRKNWSKEIDAYDIAQKSDISKPYLFKIFREHLQTSPYKYILALRINQAKLLLANREKTIKEISVKCGFSNLEVFYRQFKNITKTTPAEYRNSFLPYNFNKK